MSTKTSVATRLGNETEWRISPYCTEQAAAEHIASLVGSSCPVPGAYRPGAPHVRKVSEHVWSIPATAIRVETRSEPL